MKLEIVKADYHRNGIGGVGFYAVLFKDLDAERPDINPMIASLFMEGEVIDYGFCAVYSVPELAKGNIGFGINSWRGDRYQDALTPLLKDYLEKQDTARNERMSHAE